MTGRVTPLGLSLLTVAAWAVSLAVISARAELFIAALPLVLVVAIATRRAAAPDYAVAHEVSTDRLTEGETVTVTITITARSGVPLLELLEQLPPECELVSGRSRALVSLRPGQSTSVRYEMRGARGVYELGKVTTRARDRWGVRAWEQRHVQTTVVRIYPRIASLRSLPRPLHTQTSIGDYVSPALGEGIEPGDIRQFAPGDRIRQVNWRASLRLGTLYVTQHHRERNADVVLMLDTLADVAGRGDGTLDLSVRAAASLAAGYLTRKDRVGLINYGGTIDWVKPGTGRIQYERLVDVLLRANVVFTYVTKDLAFVPARVLPPKALVVAVTPLLDRRFTQATLDLAARGFDLVVVAVSPVEVTRSLLKGSLADDLACRLWVLERQAALDEFRRHGIVVLDWRPTDPLELALAGQGRRRPHPVAAG
jgi:uncharacterized protein (DUF58 family)